MVEKEYVNREKLINLMFSYVASEDYLMNARAVKLAIEKAPAADVVEVVRCKDCVHHTDDILNDSVVWCEKRCLLENCEFYCADGKRKGDE